MRYTDIGTGNLRGVVSFNGTDFWAQAGGGIRFVAGNAALDSSPSGTIINSTFTPNVLITTLTTMRGLALAATTPDTPQMFYGFSAASNNCGLWAVGSGLPTATVTAALQLNCTLFGMQTFVAFHFQDVNTLWAASASGGLYQFTAGPRNTTLRLVGTQWTVAPGYPVNQSNGGGLRYIAGRSESSSYVIYGISDVYASSTMVVRHVAGSTSFSVLAQSGANKWYRGIYMPPCDEAINGPCGVLSPTAFPTPSQSPSSSVAPSQTSSSSATRSSTSSVSRSRTPSASLTASSSVTASSSATSTASLPAGVSPSSTGSLTPSSSASPSLAPYVFNPASIVVWRLGSGAAIQTASAASPYFVDEVSVSADGASACVIRTIPMPTSGDAACTGSMSTVVEGGGSLSWDGRFLVMPCFTAPVGTTAAATNSSWPFRQIVRVGADSDLKFIRWSESTAGNIRGAATTNGIDFWFASGGGVRYVQADTTLDALPSGSVYLSANVSSHGVRLSVVVCAKGGVRWSNDVHCSHVCATFALRSD